MSLEKAVALVQEGKADAIATAPVSKQALHRAGVAFPGQTEIVQWLSGSRHVAMMLVSDVMRVGLATIHIPVKKVALVLTKQLLREKIGVVRNALKQDWRIRSPRIAVLALNPHASEGGDIGREDIDIVAPVVREYARRGVAGPFPADAFFGRYKKGDYDAIVAMYHDQGLIPLKMSSFGKAVNISVGMNVVRTSPDHGTAFDIAGKGIADPSSMIEAIILAAQVAINRRYG
jgi:4-hydroxythreonine-4-phosphate dehydrogenase